MLNIIKKTVFRINNGIVEWIIPVVELEERYKMKRPQNGGELKENQGEQTALPGFAFRYSPSVMTQSHKPETWRSCVMIMADFG